MKKFISIALAFAITLAFVPVSFYTARVSAAGENGLVWAVAPNLNYDRIYYCPDCNLFGFTHDGDILNPKTGLVTRDRNIIGYGWVGHSIYWWEWLYDEAKGLYALYSIDLEEELHIYTRAEFLREQPYAAKRLSAFRRADTSKIKKTAMEWDEFAFAYDLSGAYIGEKYALGFGGNFVTGYIYDGYKMYANENAVAVSLNGKWGIVNKNGSITAPFVFDDILFIDGATAFAKYNGKYGILDLKKTKPTFAAIPTASKVIADGRNIAFDAYNIGGNNYFKLRDLAYVLNGTKKQFEIGWDGAKNAVTLTSGKPYTPDGSEMKGKGAGNQNATPTTARVYLDGAEIFLTAYNIGGSNYFKLRDIGQTLNFGVDWDAKTNTIIIDTGKVYTPEA